MKRMAVALIVLAGVGCGGISKQDLDGMEERLNTRIAQVNADFERKLSQTDSKYASMLAMEQKVKNGIEAIDKNAKLLESANTTMIQILTAQRNALKEQLASVEAQLQALQNK